MKNPTVPQTIIDNLDIIKLKEWCRLKDVWHNKSKSDVQTFVVCEDFNGSVYQDETLVYRLQCENKVRKIKFKNINKIFTFYER